jgi:arylsulfatase
MYELMADNQKGKPGYETWVNNRVVTAAELLKDSGYHTYLSGKWHLSGHADENGTLPYDRGFEKSLTLLGGAANHFSEFPFPPIEQIIFAEDDKVIPRPGNKTLYSNNLWTDKMIEYIKSSTDEKPFFAYLSFQVAHSPFQSPQEDIAKYNKIYSAGWDKIREQRVDKQKELGFWDADMKLPDRIPPNQPWTELSPEQQAYASRILAIKAAMIEDMDANIGRLIQFLKDSGQYDNTLIMFTSDNGTTEPNPLLGIQFSSIESASAMESFIKGVDNTLPNLGNGTSIINPSAWGTAVAASPFSAYKTTEYEAGTRVPFIVKEPRVTSSASTSNTSNAKPSKAFAYVTDLTPTFLEYAGVQHPGSSYSGHEVHPIMGKSLKALFNGTVDRVYGETDIVVDEMFNNSAVWMGDWKAIRHQPPVGDGKWQLHNLADDPTEVVNVADQHPDILQKLISAYEKYAQDVGVVIPTGQAFYNSVASLTPPVNQSQITITSADIAPANFTK